MTTNEALEVLKNPSNLVVTPQGLMRIEEGAFAGKPELLLKASNVKTAGAELAVMEALLVAYRTLYLEHTSKVAC